MKRRDSPKTAIYSTNVHTRTPPARQEARGHIRIADSSAGRGGDVVSTSKIEHVAEGVIEDRDRADSRISAAYTYSRAREKDRDRDTNTDSCPRLGVAGIHAFLRSKLVRA